MNYKYLQNSNYIVVKYLYSQYVFFSSFVEKSLNQN